MLYISFRVSVMAAAVLGLLHMITNGTFIYIFFPIAIIIWVIYTFFDENDREYLRRNRISPNGMSWLHTEYSDYDESANTKVNSTVQYTRYYPQNKYHYGAYSNTEYKKLKDKCKRNFKITIDKEINNDRTDEL